MSRSHESRAGIQAIHSGAAHRLWPWTSMRSIPGRLYTWLSPLWREDPAIAPLLTAAFLRKFKADFDRAVREHRDSAPDAGGLSTLLSRYSDDSCETYDRLFDDVVKQYPGINALDHQHRAEVLTRLMQHCCLPGSISL